MSAPMIRYTGLVGSILLAYAAYLGGALRIAHDGITPVSIWQGENGPLILLTWLAGTVALVWAWWSARRHVPSVRWVYVTVGLWLLPLLVAPPLGSRDIYSYACQGWGYSAGYDPYTAGPEALGCPWLESVSTIWRDSPAPYGPLFVLLAGVAAAVGGSLIGTMVVLRLFAVLGMVLTAACLPALARRCGVPEGRALWLVLGCPLMAVHLVSGAHNDALMVGLLVAGLLLVVRRPGQAGPLLAGGALLGLAFSVKSTAVVVIPFAALAAMVGPYRFRGLLRDGGWVIGGSAAAILMTTVVTGLGWGWLSGLARSGDTVQWTSPPTAMGYAVEYVARAFGGQVDAVPVTRALGMLLLAVLLVVLWLRTRQLDPVRGAGLALAATVLLAPVFHPWYAVWPLAVLAVTAIRIDWYVVPCVVASFLTLPDGTNLARFTKFPGALAMAVLVVVLAVRYVRARRTGAELVAVEPASAEPRASL